jgi:hypothetical protein
MELLPRLDHHNQKVKRTYTWWAYGLVTSQEDELLMGLYERIRGPLKGLCSQRSRPTIPTAPDEEPIRLYLPPTTSITFQNKMF